MNDCGKVIVLGGEDETGCLDSCESLDTTDPTTEWETFDDLVYPRRFAACAVLNGMILCGSRFEIFISP